MKSRSQAESSAAVVYWFRRDLRLLANPALWEAAELARSSNASVVPVFVLDPALIGSGRANRLAFLFDALRSLRSSGVPLRVVVGRSCDAIPAFARQFGSAVVVCSNDYSPLGRARDEQVVKNLQRDGTELRRVGSPYLVAPGTVRKGDGTPFKVFTPFRRVWEQHLDDALRAYRTASETEIPWCETEGDDALGEIPPPPPGRASSLPVASEAAAADRLDQFMQNHLHTYDIDRNNPAADATSRLSADLKFGLLHPAQIIPLLGVGGSGPDTFRSELGWREFYADVLWHHPSTSRHAFNPSMEAMEVDTGPVADERFAAWCEGRTGFPFVDAGMRQLLAEGWMHNRMRMVTASFLVKDLHVDWRRGAAWFMEQLVDADVASNQHGWQWTAGTGTDAAPYYRIFNPVSQGRKFDPTGAYIRRYVPELAELSDAEIHEPPVAGLSGGLFDEPGNYPAPIVDHAMERTESLKRLDAVKQQTLRLRQS